ncbi:hypothetical protein V8E54_012433 [Elaphomyces granulatus]
MNIDNIHYAAYEMCRIPTGHSIPPAMGVLTPALGIVEYARTEGEEIVCGNRKGINLVKGYGYLQNQLFNMQSSIAKLQTDNIYLRQASLAFGCAFSLGQKFVQEMELQLQEERLRMKIEIDNALRKELEEMAKRRVQEDLAQLQQMFETEVKTRVAADLKKERFEIEVKARVDAELERQQKWKAADSDMLTGQPHRQIRSRFLDYYRRDRLGLRSDEIEDSIKLGNTRAHAGDPIVDDFDDPDEATFMELYGLSPAGVIELRHVDYIIKSLSEYATMKVDTPVVDETFAKFLNAITRASSVPTH